MENFIFRTAWVANYVCIPNREAMTHESYIYSYILLFDDTIRDDDVDAVMSHTMHKTWHENWIIWNWRHIAFCFSLSNYTFLCKQH